MLKLVRPSLEYKKSYREFMEALRDAGSPDYDGTLPAVAAAIRKWKQISTWLPGSSHFWLVDGKEYIGAISIDHQLLDLVYETVNWRVQRPVANPGEVERELLSLGMDELKKMALERFLPSVRTGGMRTNGTPNASGDQLL